MSTGFNGTPMPAFVDGLAAEQRWAITDYIVSLSGSDGPGYSNLVVATYVKEPIDIAKGAASFASAPVARFPIVGQIMEPGRSFHPPATSVSVQAIYDDKSIAVLVRWHDRTAEKTGQNGPSLPVPPEEEEEAASGASRAGRQQARSAMRKWRQAGRPAGRGPLRRSRGAGRDLRVLRCRRDPDSVGDAGWRPQALLHLRRRRELGRSLVLRSGAGGAAAVHGQGQRGRRCQGSARM